MSEPTVDPVTKFVIPGPWIERTDDPDVLEKVKSGRWVLLSDGTLLRRGYTTGTTAAAACKGAVLSLASPTGATTEVNLLTPAGIRVPVPVRAEGGICTASKVGGDHESDVTAGMVIRARAKTFGETVLVAGHGIGRINSRGLCAPLGKAAISQSARQEIMSAIEEGLEATGLPGARVELEVPNGEEIALRTLNPKVGVKGGISILGSTGFVEPWNEHLGKSRGDDIKNLDKVVVTTGRVGLKYSRILFPNHVAVLIGNKLDRLNLGDQQDSILCGLPALILKWGMPEVLEGTGYRTVAEMIENQQNHPRIDTALRKVRERLPNTRIVLLRRDGSVLRDDKT